MNKVLLMGRLTRDPETVVTPNTQTTISKFTIAVDKRHKEGADFITCKAIGKLADVVDKYLKKGRQICVTGKLDTGSYTNRDGKKVYTVEVLLDEFDFCDRASGAADEAPAEDFQPVADVENLPFN